jgi:Skp family chaperone for outer membrane proteins
MKNFFAVALGLIFSCIAANAAPRIALVRVTDTYRDLPSTAELQTKVREEKEAVLQDERAEELRRVIAELQVLQAQLQDKSAPPDDETSRNLARDYEIKRQEAQTLQEEFENFRQDRNKDINARMVKSMRDSLDLIVGISTKLAREQGYDGVFDASGNTNTGVPFILFSKNAPDLTDEVKAALKDATAKIDQKKATTPEP